MSPAEWNRIEELFHEALDRAPEQRDAFLRNACNGDHMLLSRIQDLLQAGTQDDAFIEPPAMALAQAEPNGRATADELPRLQRLGGYEIVRVLAHGGMGTVYEAVQLNPRRTVALKVLPAAHASPETLRRFQHESQVLARLQHPAIAQVYSAGTFRDAEHEVPYFAMEYVAQARSIVEYGLDEDLTLAQRLRLFAEVCDAVQYGHQLGIIHRDLKPANILVDVAGQTKVIDFGVARATDPRRAQTTLRTTVGQLIGTLSYMSPEQCGGDSDAIDTRSDVYSLGVVLYEMLCGELPYDLAEVGLPESTHIIQQQPPRRPSIKRPELRGDLETIILKALSKDPDHRYQTVADLARDMRCFLNREPIQARPHSMRYQLRLFTRRNRAMVSAAVCALLTLTAGAALSTIFGLRAMHAARAEATQRAKAEQISAFLGDIITSASPYRFGRNVTLKDMLQDAANRADRELIGQPEVEADVRYTIAETYGGLWMWDEVNRHVRRALVLYRQADRPDEQRIASCLTLLGRACSFRGNPVEAMRAQHEAIAIRKQVLGAEHPKVAEALCNLAWAHWGGQRMPDWHQAERLYMTGIEMFKLCRAMNTRDAARCLFSYACMLVELGRDAEAENLYRESLAIYQSLPRGADSYMFEATNNFGHLLMGMGRSAEGEILLREALALNPEGYKIRRITNTLWALSRVTHGRKDHAEALRFYALAIANVCRVRAETCRVNRAALLQFADTLSTAAPGSGQTWPFAEACKMLRQYRDRTDRVWKLRAHNIADVLVDYDPQAAEAVCLFGLSLTQDTAMYHRLDADTRNILACSLARQGRLDEAEPMMLESFTIIEAEYGESSAFAHDARVRIAELYEMRGDSERAAEWRPAGTADAEEPIH